MNKNGFDSIYEAHADIVLRTATHFSGNYHVAQEIMQTTFLTFYLKMDEMETDNIRAWLLTVAKNLSMNSRKKRSREISEGDIALIKDLHVSEDSSEDVVMDLEHKHELAEFCDSMFNSLYKKSPRWFEAITMTYCLGIPQKRTAEELGISIEVLQNMLYRARNWLKENFKERYLKYFKK